MTTLTLHFQADEYSMSSVFQLLDDMQQLDDARAFGEKRIYADWPRQKCMVVLRQVRDALELMQNINRNLKTLSTIHSRPIQLTRIESAPARSTAQ